jgi:hypothetical protein
MVHEEFVHPHLRKKGTYPRNPDTNALYACLLVSGTQWLASFTETELLMYKDCKHYRFLTDVPIVDVLSTGDVSAEWQEQQEG